MVKHTQTIRRQIACVWPFCEIGAKRVNIRNEICRRSLTRSPFLSQKLKSKIINIHLGLFWTYSLFSLKSLLCEWKNADISTNAGARVLINTFSQFACAILLFFKFQASKYTLSRFEMKHLCLSAIFVELLVLILYIGNFWLLFRAEAAMWGVL